MSSNYADPEDEIEALHHELERVQSLLRKVTAERDDLLARQAIDKGCIRDLRDQRKTLIREHQEYRVQVAHEQDRLEAEIERLGALLAAKEQS